MDDNTKIINKDKLIKVRIDENMHNHLVQLTKKNNVTRSKIVRYLLEKYIEYQINE